MSEPREREKAVCGLCGEQFVVTNHYKIWCGQSCEFKGTWTPPPEHAAFLEASTAAFVAAVRADVGYMIEIAAAGSRLMARQAA
ncbi:hypothetical protein [Microbacterium testaceum]|uniref:hypothetical protein n=1 Tax=Microbacterium testaceum TaxID=2033 RepID=UPI0037FDEC54